MRIKAPKLLILEALHGPRHLQGQRPIPCIERIHRSFIAIRMAAGGGHQLQGLERIVAPLPLQPAGLAEADHVVGQASSQQGLGQLIRSALIRRQRQQVHIRVGIPIATSQ